MFCVAIERILFRAVATCITLRDLFPPAVQAATALLPSLPRRQRQPPRPPVSPPPRRRRSPAQAHLPLCQPLRHPLVPAPPPAEGRASGPVPGHLSVPARSCTWNPVNRRLSVGFLPDLFRRHGTHAACPRLAPADDAHVASGFHFKELQVTAADRMSVSAVLQAATLECKDCNSEAAMRAESCRT